MSRRDRGSADSGRADRRTGTTGSGRYGRARTRWARRCRSEPGTVRAGRAREPRRSGCRSGGSSDGCEECDRLGRDPAARAFHALEVAARSLDVDRARGEVEQRRNPFADLDETAREPRPGTDDQEVNAHRPEAGARHETHDITEQFATRDPSRRPRVGREEAPQIAESRRSEEPIADGM